MRFSELQKKEVIEVKKGSFLGFVQDATIDMKNGKIDVLQIGGAERSLFLDSKMKDLKQIKYDDVFTIGKDIVLVGKKTEQWRLIIDMCPLSWYNKAKYVEK